MAISYKGQDTEKAGQSIDTLYQTASLVSSSLIFTTLGGVTSSINLSSLSGSFSGSIAGTASFALTSSYSTTLGASLANNGSGQLTLRNSNASTISTISKLTASLALTASQADSSSYALTASYILDAVSSSFASTASFVNTLNQNVIITGSVAIGTGSVGNGESSLILGPAAAGGTGEGGQLGLLAKNDGYTSSSFIDTWQDQFRILRGPGATSNAGLVYVNLQSGNTQFVGAVTASAYSGLPNSWLHATRNSSQTIASGTWADRDVIFEQEVSNNFTYNTSTGIATLKAGKTYRITARLAWSAAGLYTLKFRVYNQTTSAFTGPTVELIQSPNGTYNVSDATLETIFNVGASDTDISIRTTSDTNALTGEYIRGDLNTQLIIQQIA